VYFSAAVSFSGAMDISSVCKNLMSESVWTFGPKSPRGTDADLFKLLRDGVAGKVKLPRLSMYCGAKDFLYGANLRMCAELRRLGVAFDYYESPEHAHTWDYWDLCVADVLKKLPLEK
jgi:S-formylglutathione hydrolase FrmB